MHLLDEATVYEYSSFNSNSSTHKFSNFLILLENLSARYSRWHGDGLEVRSRWLLTGGHLGVHVTVQLGADVVVA